MSLYPKPPNNKKCLVYCGDDRCDCEVSLARALQLIKLVHKILPVDEEAERKMDEIVAEMNKDLKVTPITKKSE